MIYGHFLSEFESLNNDSFVNFEILILGFEKSLRRWFCKFEMQNLNNRGLEKNWQGGLVLIIGKGLVGICLNISQTKTDWSYWRNLARTNFEYGITSSGQFRRVSPHRTIFGSLNLKLHKSTLPKQSWHIEMLILRRRFFLIHFLFSFYSEAWRLTIRGLVWADFEVNWVERLLWKFAPRFNLGFPTQKPIPDSERLGHITLKENWVMNICKHSMFVRI